MNKRTNTKGLQKKVWAAIGHDWGTLAKSARYVQAAQVALSTYDSWLLHVNKRVAYVDTVGAEHVVRQGQARWLFDNLRLGLQVIEALPDLLRFVGKSHQWPTQWASLGETIDIDHTQTALTDMHHRVVATMDAIEHVLRVEHVRARNLGPVN